MEAVRYLVDDVDVARAFYACILRAARAEPAPPAGRWASG